MDDEARTRALAEEIERALDPFREALRSDGYEIELASIAPGQLEFTIKALDGACEECLVPEQVMAQMIASDLPPAVSSAKISIHYPRH